MTGLLPGEANVGDDKTTEAPTPAGNVGRRVRTLRQLLRQVISFHHKGAGMSGLLCFSGVDIRFVQYEGYQRMKFVLPCVIGRKRENGPGKHGVTA